jgi:hypothetical protein
MDYIHTWLNKWRMQGNFTKEVMVFHPKVNLQRAGDRRNAWTPAASPLTRSASISTYVVYQEDDHGAGTRKGAVRRQRSTMVQIHSAVMYGAEVDTTKAVKDKMSAVVKKALRSIQPCIPETALLTFCTGTLGYFHPVCH